MCPRPVTVRPDDSLAGAVALLDALGLREAVVTDGGRIAGILTRTDLEPHLGHFEWTRVRAAMTADPVTVPPEMAITDAARVLVEHGFNCLPVQRDGAVVGMLRRSDLVRALVEV